LDLVLQFHLLEEAVESLQHQLDHDDVDQLAAVLEQLVAMPQS
jgi:hypothetical protein